MCAINPTHKKRLILDVYTAHPTMTEGEFLNLVLFKVLETEQELNKDGKLRWHIKTSNQEAD